MTNRSHYQKCRAPRHQRGSAPAARVQIVRTSQPSLKPIEALLQNLSRGGCQALASRPLGEDAMVVLRLFDSQDRPLFEAPAVVRWQRQDSQTDNGWLLGFEFVQELAWETLGELFLQNMLSQDG